MLRGLGAGSRNAKCGTLQLLIMDCEKELIKYFRKKEQADNLTTQDIRDLINCITPAAISKILRDLAVDEQLIQDSLEDLTDIIITQPLAHKPPATTPTEVTLLESDKAEFYRLQEDCEHTAAVKTPFSYQHLCRMIYHAYRLGHPQLESLQQECPDKPSLEGLREEASKLAETLRNEGKDSESILQNISSIQNSSDPSKILIELLAIKDKTVFLDIPELSRLIRSSREAQNQISGESAVVFIGGTGAGKSTAILSLLGYEMAVKLWNNMTWLTTRDAVTDKEAQKLVSSPSTKSVTRDVTYVKYRGDCFSLTSTFFVDTPGFEDTEGPEVDISNSIGVAKAIRSLGKARFVVIMGGLNQGNRGEGIKKLASTLCSIFPNYSEIRQGVLFVFNRFSDTRGLNSLIKSIWEELGTLEKSTQNLEDIYGDLIAKTRYGSSTSEAKSVLDFNPLQGHAESTLEKIGELSAVSNLGSKIHIDYSRRSSTAIDRQLKFLEDQITTYFGMDQIDVAVYFFELLDQLHSLLQGEDAVSHIEEARARVSGKISEKVAQQVEREVRGFRVRVGNRSLAAEDIEQYKREMERCDKYRPLKHFVAFGKIREKFKSGVDEGVSTLLDTLKKGSLEPKEVGDAISTLTLLTRHFQKQDVIEGLLADFRQRVEEESALYSNRVKDGNYHESMASYSLCKMHIGYLSQLGDSDSEDQLKTLDCVALDEAKASCLSGEALISNLQNVSEAELSALIEISSRFLKMSKSYEYLGRVPRSQEILSVLGSFDAGIKARAKEIAGEISASIEACKNVAPEFLRRMSQNHSRMQAFSRIPHLQAEVPLLLQNIQRKLSLCIEGANSCQKELLSALKEKKVKFNVLSREMNRLDSSIHIMEKLSEFIPDSPEYSHFEQIKEELSEWLGNLEFEVKKIKLVLNDASIKEKMDKLSEALEVIEAFKEKSPDKQRTSKIFNDPDLRQLSELIKGISHNLIKETLQKIGEHLSLLKAQGDIDSNDASPEKYRALNLKTIELCLGILSMGAQTFKDIDDEQKKFEHTKEQFKAELIKYCCFLIHKIESNLSAIKTNIETGALKELVRNTKEKLLVVEHIEQRYSRVKEAMINFDYSALREETLHRLQELEEDLRSEMGTHNKQGVDSSQVAAFQTKCQSLSQLDPYIGLGQGFTFSRLYTESKELVAKMQTTLEARFNYAFEMRDYKMVETILNALKETKSAVYEDSCRRMIMYIQQLLENIKKLKSKEQMHDNIEKLLELAEEVSLINNSLSTHLPEDIKQKIGEMCASAGSIAYRKYDDIASEMEQLLGASRVSEVHLRIRDLEKLEVLLVESKNNAQNVDRVRKIKDDMNLFIAKFKKEIEQHNELLNVSDDFKSKFSTVFEPLDTNHPELVGIKSDYTKRVEAEIEALIVTIQTDQHFSSSSVASYKKKLKNVPKYIKLEQMNRVNQVIDTKRLAWLRETQNMEKDVDGVDAITCGRINPKVISYIVYPEANKTIVNTLKAKIQNQLEKILSALPVDSISSFHEMARKSTEFETPKECPEELLALYCDIESRVESKATNVVKDLVFKVAKDTIRPAKVPKQEGQNQQRFLKDAFECLRLASQESCIVIGIKEIIRRELQGLFNEVFAYISELRSGGFDKAFLSPKTAEQEIRDSLAKMSKLHNCCRFANMFLESCETYKTVAEVEQLRGAFAPRKPEADMSEEIVAVLKQYTLHVQFLSKCSVKSANLEHEERGEVDRFFEKVLETRNYVSLTLGELCELIGRDQGQLAEVMDRNFADNIEGSAKQLLEKLLEMSADKTGASITNNVDMVRGCLKVLDSYDWVFESKKETQRSSFAVLSDLAGVCRELASDANKMIIAGDPSQIPKVASSIEVLSQIYVNLLSTTHPVLEQLINESVFEAAESKLSEKLKFSLKNELYKLKSPEYHQFLKKYPQFQKIPARQSKLWEPKDVQKALATLSKGHRETLSNLYLNFSKRFSTIVAEQEKETKENTIDALCKMVQEVARREDSLIDAVSYLFAIHHYHQSTEENGQRVFGSPPSPSQVVAVLTLLGAPGVFSDAGIDKNNILVSLGFREGKSLVLAVVCCYLGLREYEVDCLFQSEYTRDRYSREYQYFFGRMSVSHRIRNVTLQEIAGSLFNLRYASEQCSKFINQNVLPSPAIKEGAPSGRRVLLMEEATTLCSEEYYGRCYEPSITLSYEVIKSLLRLVFEESKRYGEDISLEYILLRSQDSQKYQHIWDLVEKQVRLMIQAARNYNNPNCFWQNNKVMVRVGGAYYEAEKLDYQMILQTLSEHSKAKTLAGSKVKSLGDHNCSPSLSLGKISYCEIPAEYNHVLGMSSAPFSQRELAILQSMFQVKHTLDFPQLNITPVEWNLTIQPFSNYWKHVMEQIAPKKEQGIQKPTIVIFKDVKQLSHLYYTSVYKQSGTKANIVHEYLSKYAISNGLEKSLIQGTVTFATRKVLVGLDLLPKEQVIKMGGMRLVQTYLSMREAEELQLMESLALNDIPAEYTLVIKNSTHNGLDPHNNKNEDVHKLDPQQRKDLVKQARSRLAETFSQGQKQNISELREEHEATKKFLKEEPKTKELIVRHIEGQVVESKGPLPFNIVIIVKPSKRVKDCKDTLSDAVDSITQKGNQILNKYDMTVCVKTVFLYKTPCFSKLNEFFTCMKVFQKENFGLQIAGSFSPICKSFDYSNDVPLKVAEEECLWSLPLQHIFVISKEESGDILNQFSPTFRSQLMAREVRVTNLFELKWLSKNVNSLDDAFADVLNSKLAPLNKNYNKDLNSHDS